MQKTEVRILYDDKALYVSAKMFDVHRDSIKQQLNQRDEEGVTDIFSLLIDTYDDDMNAFIEHQTCLRRL